MDNFRPAADDFEKIGSFTNPPARDPAPTECEIKSAVVLGAKGLMSDKVFDMALAKDPTNKKAQFYKAFLKAPMTLKGAVKRVLPAVRKYGDINKYQTWQQLSRTHD